MELDELLKREKEYYDLNNELEIKTKHILQQVDDVIKTQDIMISNKDYFVTSNSTTDQKCVQPTTNLKNNINDNVKMINIKECKDLNLPPDVSNMGTKGLIIFLKAKLKKLQMDNDKLNLDFQTKCNECRKFQNESQTLIEDKTKWLQTITINKNQAHKLENQLNLLQSKLHTKDIENNNLKKEIEHLKKQIKNDKIMNTNTDAKLNKALEDSEKMKSALKTAKQEEKDNQENFKKQTDAFTNTIKKLEKQKCDLESGFKKQLLLIENLKKQKVLIENLKLGEKVGKDFIKILDWNIEKNK